MEIGKRIQSLRDERNWTTNRLANLSGLSQSFLRAVELGEKGISVESLALLCDTMGISLRQFFDVATEMDTLDDTLLRQIEALTPEQKQLLSKLLATF